MSSWKTGLMSIYCEFHTARLESGGFTHGRCYLAQPRLELLFIARFFGFFFIELHIYPNVVHLDFDLTIVALAIFSQSAMLYPARDSLSSTSSNPPALSQTAKPALRRSYTRTQPVLRRKRRFVRRQTV